MSDNILFEYLSLYLNIVNNSQLLHTLSFLYLFVHSSENIWDIVLVFEILVHSFKWNVSFDTKQVVLSTFMYYLTEPLVYQNVPLSHNYVYLSILPETRAHILLL